MSRMRGNTVFRFIIVGIFNTLFAFILMFAFLNIFQYGYWISTFTGNFVAFLFAFILSKVYIFRYRDHLISTFIKFTVNFFAIYLFSYIFSFLVTNYLFQHFIQASDLTLDNLSALIGFILFPIGNYLGQRYFVFPEKKEVNIIGKV